jgi:beta-mannosidase
MLRFIYLSLVLAFLPMDASSQIPKPVAKFLIDGNWQMKQADSTDWLAVQLPSSVHTALIQHKKIEDPFYRDNEEKTQWIETKDWEYELTFDVPEEVLAKTHVDLKWAGLDTYAQIYLNDTLVLETNNMFRTWQTDVKKWLKPTGNVLHVYIESPVNKPKPEWDALGYTLPGGIRTMTRKAQYHYGWDWGPKLTGCGIYKKPELVGWNDFIIDDFRVTMREYTPEKAIMVARFLYRADQGGVVATSLRRDKTKDVGDLTLRAGVSEDSIIFTIDNPRLWWCRGMGEQYMYDVKLEIKRGYTLLDAAYTRTGLRTTELVRESDEKGTTFYIKLNGKPVFCKGANYIPLEVFNDRATPEKYSRIIGDAVEGNMNMLRVWGGGVYEDDAFYELCDAKGIMVWQDFMYACALYPGNGAFMKNAAAEAYENIVRIRKHPSVVLWCGNNENNEAWHNWGWQMNFTEEQRTRLWSHYKLLFNEILPTYVSNYADGVPYWESSPSFGRANQKSLTEGDAHDWGVWHDEAPFSRFETHVPRFMSEYGFQSFPEWSTIEQFSLPEERYLDSKVMMMHQKHPKGNQLIATYMKRSYQVPKDFKHFTYLSQLLQAEGMRTGIEAHRRNKPYCMGTLYWQLNDVWPVASWSGIDYFGNWKALHYYARSAFAQVAVVPEVQKDKLKVYLTAEVPDTAHVTLRIKAMGTDGDVVFELEKPNLTVTNDRAEMVWSESLTDILKGQRRENTFILLTLHDVISGVEIHRRVLYLAEPKDMKLSDTKPKVEVIQNGNECTVKLQSDRLVRGVRLYLPKAKKYSDNYFDLLPGEAKTVIINLESALERPAEQLDLLYLNML